MKELLDKVKRELEKIGDKGLTSSNLDTTFKLIDIYKDIKESEYYEAMCEGESYGARTRDSRGRYAGKDDEWYSGLHERYYPWGDREERYFDRIRQGMDNYAEGKTRYRDGSSQDKMLDGIELAMTALVNFVETLYDHVETPKEKDVIREHIDKLKKL